MSRESRGRAHLGTEALLDLLEDRLDPARRRAAEEHLGRPCGACREHMRRLGALLSTLRSDRLEAVPAELHARALAVFPGRAVPESVPSGLARRLALVFDSLTEPLSAAARRSVGEARRLRFVEGDTTLELECEPESAEQFTLRGRLNAGDPDLHRVEAEVGGERLETWVDAGGAFVIEGLPMGEVRLTVHGPSGRFQAPPFTP
jgi:hypothetical protein